jgi:hypothetical protein
MGEELLVGGRRMVSGVEGKAEDDILCLALGQELMRVMPTLSLVPSPS